MHIFAINRGLFGQNESYQRGLSSSPFIRVKESSAADLQHSNMSYNPKITPLTITVGPAASYHEPPEPPGTTQVSQIPQIPQVQQPASYCQQPLTVVGRRRNHCNKSCLVAILLIIASVIILLTLLAAWFWGAFDHHEDKKYGHHATKMPADYKHKCPKHYLMYNGKCDESIYKDWR